MRLSSYQRDTLKQTAVQCFHAGVVVKLFGSRTQDDKRGGDIDLLIQTTLTNPSDIAKSHVQFLTQIQKTLGEQKIDLLIDYPDQGHKPPIFKIAHQEGILL